MFLKIINIVDLYYFNIQVHFFNKLENDVDLCNILNFKILVIPLCQIKAYYINVLFLIGCKLSCIFFFFFNEKEQIVKS